MKTLYCIICDKYRKTEKPKISYLLEKTLTLSFICSKCKHEDEKVFKEEAIGLINNIEEYQKMYNHVLRKNKSRI